MIFRFTLTYSGNDTVVDAPRGWDAFESEIDRKLKSHGAVYKYMPGVLTLGFADGRDVLEDAFQAEGFDANVTLTIDERENSLLSWSNLFVGKAVMPNRELDIDYFECDFEAVEFQQLVTNRMKSKLRLDTLIDLDGNTLTGALTSYTNDWDSIRLFKRHYATFKHNPDYTTFSITDTGLTGTEYNHTVRMNFANGLDSDLEEYQTVAETFTQNATPANAFSTQLENPNFIINLDGDGSVGSGFLHYRAHGTITINTGTAPISVAVTWRFLRAGSDDVVIENKAIASETFSEPTLTTFNYDSGVRTIGFTAAEIDNMLLGDHIYIYPEFNVVAASSTNMDITHNYELYHDTRLDLKVLKEQETYSVKFWQIFDVINWMIYIITGQKDRLVSDFLNITENGADEDGCGGLNVISLGTQLRGLDTSIESSLDSVLKSIMAIYGLGWGFERDYNNDYSVRVEPMEFFYADNEILDLGSPVSIKKGNSYTETVAEELLINRVEVGYEKYTNDEDHKGNLDDFSTLSEYSLPIKSVEGKYTQKSSLITSSRLIQATFEKRNETEKTWKLDKSLFLIAVTRNAGNFIPEHDQNFETVEGVDDPGSVYNLRHAPVYMMLNHALFVNSALFGKDFSATIINTVADVNKDFVVQFDQYEACLLGDSQRLERSSTGNITIGNNYNGLRLWKPVKHTLTVAMSNAQFNAIVDAMEGAANDTTNRGYLTYRDSEGAAQKGFPLNIKRSPIKSVAEIETIEKADNYGV